VAVEGVVDGDLAGHEVGDEMVYESHRGPAARRCARG
jgi:hypothetical protein